MMTRTNASALHGVAALVVFSFVAGCATANPTPAQGEARAALKIAQLRPAANDLPVFRVVDPATALVFLTYYDPAVEEVARAAIPAIADMYRDVAQLVAADPGLIDWSAVAFVQDSAYVPPRQGGEVRWSVLVAPSGRLDSAGTTFLYGTLPHEQVHAIQGTLKPGLPRWFSEGMAEWAGLQVTHHRAPALAEQRRAELRRAYESLATPLDLASWGGMRVKPEAILRQVTAEQRARMETDPSYTPPGPFSLGPDDLISDEANTTARYGGSLALFEMLEQTAGQERMRAWFQAVWQAQGRLSTAELIALAKEYTGVDVQPLFER